MEKIGIATRQIAFAEDVFPSDLGFENIEEMSDGYHTFKELYDHRIALWIALCEAIWAMNIAAIKFGHPEATVSVWRSKNHSDGEPAFGGAWFVLGIAQEKGKQITYHLPIGRWDECEFAETLERAPEFDGHTSADVLERIKSL